MSVKTWKLRYLEDYDPTPRRMLGWNVVDWSEYDNETNNVSFDNKIRKWIKENLTKGTYRISYQYPECLIERDEDVAWLVLKWSANV